MRFILVVLALLAAASAHAQQNPVVLIVHGRGQFGRDSAEFRRDAFHALEASLHDADADFKLAERDVRLVWYADVLDARASGVAVPTCGADQISDSLRERESVPSALSLMAMFAGPLLDAASTDAKGDDANNLRGFAGDLRYLADLDTRCAAERRVADALRDAKREGRPVILVSHSLGALVTWGELSHAASVRDTTIGPISQWITLGSPLGSAEIRELIFGDVKEKLQRPAAVRSWVNIVGTDDPFAVRLGGEGDLLADVTSAKAHSDPHHILSYLYDTATARAVIAAWHK